MTTTSTDKPSSVGGLCGRNDLPEWDEALVEIRNDYRWTPPCQRAFLEELAATGSVMRACQLVGKAARGAYGLRYRREGAAFALGWNAAVLIAREVLFDTLMDRAMNGYEEISQRDPDGSTTRGKFDNRLGQGLLGRLDRIADTQPVAGSGNAMVQLVKQDWEGFLELVGGGGTGAAAALFCAVRVPVEAPAIDCELGQETVGCEATAAAQAAELTPEEYGARLSVWYDNEDKIWLTDFPLRCDQDAEQVEEEGEFGKGDYSRTLTPDEEAIQRNADAEAWLPFDDAARAAYAAWFVVKDAA